MIRRRASAIALAVASALLPAAARSEQPRAQDRGATDGVDRTWHDYSAEGDASSLELNPALLSDLRGLDLTLLGYGAVSNFTRGGGFGGFFGVGLPLRIAAAFGVQIVRPRLDADVHDAGAEHNPDLAKIGFGLALPVGEHAALGLGVHGVRAAGAWLQRPDLDLGTLTRITNYGSLGVAARLSPGDLSSSVLPALFSLTGELSLRPLGTHHLELAGGLTQRVLQADVGMPLSSQDIDGLLAHGRIAVRFQGLALKGEVQQVHASVLDPVTLDRIGGEKALRGAVTIEAGWDVVRAGVGVHAGVSEELDGVGVSARLTTRGGMGRAFWPRRVDAERIDVSAVDDQRELIALLQRLELARAAGERSVLVVDARGTDLGWAALHELREALVRVRDAGGHVFAYVEDASTRDYYLASVAERVYVHPAGGLSIQGLQSRAIYLRGTLDKLGVRAEVIRVREYKSAAERFTGTEPSPEDRLQRTALLEDTYDRVVYDIARARGLSLSDVRARIGEAPHGPEDARTLGLVDDIVHRDELVPAISEVLGTEVEFREFPDPRPDETWDVAPYLAVVLVEGTIVDGESRFIPILDLKFAGGDTIAQTLRDLREDRACRGIILRVDSPGGSALASDIIWREVSRTHEAWKADPRANPPVIVSMSDVAASGGYYVAAGAPLILADPMTITGSIGVISIHFDVSGLLAKLGVSTTTFKTNETADLGSPFRPYSEEETRRLEASIQRTYGLFVDRVAAARGMTDAEVDAVGRGRVWSGVDAREQGLVDAMGGLHEAIAAVRERADVDDRLHLELRVLPRQRRLIDLLLPQPSKPFGGLRNAIARRRAEKADLAGMIPAALDRALASVPLSILWLPQDAAHAILPAQVRID